MISRQTLRVIGPGLIVAATGVGAGDLAAASMAGSHLGLAVLWAVAAGAFFKFVLNEGLARWQLATGSTLLEGAVAHLGRPVQCLFLVYLALWSFLVAAALMSAIGVTSHAMVPLMGVSAEAAQTDKIIYGVLHSVLAVVLVRFGGFRIFDKAMGALVVLMFVIVVITAVALQPPLGQVLRGLFVPTIPRGGVGWTIALMGGIGGTVTVLSYGYWIREVGRNTAEDLGVCRVDLACAYAMTALFGLGMVIVGNSVPAMEGTGARLMVQLAVQLEATFGAAGLLAKWAFLTGAWAAVFTSLLGVWQSTPYLFADLWRQMMRVGATAGLSSSVGRGRQLAVSAPHAELPKGQLQEGNSRSTANKLAVAPEYRSAQPVEANSFAYQAYLYAIASVPIIGLVGVNFSSMMKVYAIVGALFIPMLAAVLLYLNGQARWIGQQHKNSWVTSAVLVGALLLFAIVAAIEVRDNLFAAN
ncbi:MAG TPA: Nramp family divalent metal transporter [Lacipirellulaceae bacterium]|nr:Nramp family divalent metal transporter [Lacipirellulaceae bacterium]